MHKPKECQRCGETSGELRPVDGEWLCKGCMDEEIIEYIALLSATTTTWAN